jgi:phosphoribosyl-ATP pyrophosphohydrolase/phosphoribosyl-AMP cyclohydrolase
MKLDFAKQKGLVPAIIQDYFSRKVLMLGYMNEAAIDQTISSGLVTFYSRSRKQLWTKGESSGNYLHIKEILPDCDRDTLLILATADGPACHTGADTCFGEVRDNEESFLFQLENLLEERKLADPKASYTAKLWRKGIDKIAQKVGEEATEVIIAAMREEREEVSEESADLLYHLLLLLQWHNLSLKDISGALENRHRQKSRRVAMI